MLTAYPTRSLRHSKGNFGKWMLGVTLTNGTVERYASLLEEAILSADGESLDGNVWQDFVAGIDCASKYEGVIRSIGSTLGDSSSEVAQVIAVSNATINTLSDVPIDQAEQFLADDLEAIQPTDAEPYAHLDNASRIALGEADRVFGAPDPSRPEPSHIASDDGGEGDDS